MIDLSYRLLSGMQELAPLNDIVKYFNTRYSYKEIKEVYEEIKYLKEQGLLFSTFKPWSQGTKECY
ncbi:MAG: hypothetical protein HPY66_3402 [Firmicutes bacterium]|nr:hypothetical protein [Bacillota bacterium]